MNLLEHYIKEIHNVEDVSDKYEKAIRQKPKEPLYEVDVTVDCYGVVERKRRFMSKSEAKAIKVALYHQWIKTTDANGNAVSCSQEMADATYRMLSLFDNLIKESDKEQENND